MPPRDRYLLLSVFAIVIGAAVFLGFVWGWGGRIR